jgi:hypothetical protein
MTIWILLTIISSVALIIFIIWGVVSEWDGLLPYVTTIIMFILMIVGIIAIAQKVTLRSEVLRQKKERQQILYQIENMTEDSDKVKLNEWILTYNDWVNDVTTSQELYGWFSWYAGVDMTDHTIIELV